MEAATQMQALGPITTLTLVAAVDLGALILTPGEIALKALPIILTQRLYKNLNKEIMLQKSVESLQEPLMRRCA